MTSQSHLQIFQTSQDEESSFTLFPHLPQEIRQKIWKHSLQRQRIIKVLLTPRTTEEAAEDLTNPALYHIFADGHQVSSKLLRVNSEARSTALSFYRVHLPCNLKSRAPDNKPVIVYLDPEHDQFKPGVLHLNPEHDFLQITPKSPVKKTLIALIHDLKTVHDPKHIGLLNLAMTLNDLNAHDLHRLQPSHLAPEVKNSFTETLSQLHEVFFVESARAGRRILGPLSGIMTSDYFFNRSMPILANTPSFERLQRDPRNVKADLRRVFVGTADPRQMVKIWRDLLARWGIRAPETQYKFQLSFDPTLSSEIYDHEGARKWLQKEDDVWTGRDRAEREDDLYKHFPIGAQCVDEDLESVARPAVGFWLFSLEALGPMREEGEPEGFRHLPKRILDLREYWPELCLLHLS